jgi:hypothetical protein
MTARQYSAWVLAAACLSAPLAGCADSGEVRVGFAGAMLALTDASALPSDQTVFDAARHTVELAAGANEAGAFQTVIDAGPEGAPDVTVEFSELAGPLGKSIGADAVRAYRMWPVRIDRFPAWYLLLSPRAPASAGYYDILSPIDSSGAAQAFSLAPGERAAFWTDVDVPRDAPPGVYKGRVVVRSAGRAVWQCGLEMRVCDYVLPDARPIVAMGGFDYREVFAAFVKVDGRAYVPDHLDRRYEPVRDGLTRVRRLMEIAHKHGLDLFDSALHPQIVRRRDGSIGLDWTDYDAIAGPYLTGSAFADRLAVAAWPMPFSADWPDPGNYRGTTDPAYRRDANAVIRACLDHFTPAPAPADGADEPAGASPSAVAAKDGRAPYADAAGRAAMFYWPYRADVSREGYYRHAALARAIRQSDTLNPVLSRMPLRPPAMTAWSVPEDFDRLVDMSAPPAEWLDPSLAATWDTGLPVQPGGRIVGVYIAPGAPPYGPTAGVLASPADMRVMPWLAMRYRCAGLFIPDVLGWDKPVSALRTDETHLFYPGSIVGVDDVLPSARLKRLRCGLQDAARLDLLVKRQQPGIARALLESMARYAGTDAAGDNYLDPRADGWVSDPAAWDIADRLLTTDVADAVHPENYSGPAIPAERADWNRLNQYVHGMNVERAWAELNPRAGGGMRATVRLDLSNRYLRGVSVSAALADLPLGWRPINAVADIGFLPPGATRTVELAADGADIPPAGAGKMSIGVLVRAGDDFRASISAEAAGIRAAPAGRHIDIDGKLDDWPMRPGGSAGAFRLVGRRGRPPVATSEAPETAAGADAGAGLAVRQTSAFVLTGEGNLHVALRCDEPDPAQMIDNADNIVRYQQLLATGEDLVEIVLDPGRRASGPEGLYHVVVKANGIVVATRGIRTDPPLGPSQAWAAAITSAVGVYKDFWVAEIAIPLSAFGGDGDADVWGVNFARFATRGAEASSWTGAARYFYNPRELGCMTVERDEPSTAPAATIGTEPAR